MMSKKKKKKMSSQMKPTVVPKVFKGKSFFTELGVAKFHWTIEDFNKL